jgi:para-nitrobenzyl esterase
MWRGVAGVSLALLMTGCVATSESANQPDATVHASPGIEVATPAGMLRGELNDAGDVRVFRGIPYAAPPVGERRWRPPSDPAPWQGVRPANRFGASCWQVTGDDGSIYSKGITDPSEDCLYLNVFTPAGADRPLPVMVWFHGGGNTAGTGSSAIFDGSTLARLGAVVVTINYRLGAFGFLAHPALTDESPERSSGNYGLLDQIAALRWVRDAIAGFGGDPGRVTIFGQSAGSWDVCALMTSPLSAGLFHRAIGQSGQCLQFATRLDGSGAASAHATGIEAARRLGVEGSGAPALAALRMVEARTVFDTLRGRVPATPIVDGWVLPVPPREAFGAGRFHRVPLIVGTMANETTAASESQRTREAYAAMLETRFGASAGRVREAYADLETQSIAAAAAAVQTDAGQTRGAREWARAVDAAGGDVRVYWFRHAPPAFRLYRDDPAFTVPEGPRGLGAYHSGDLAYVFGNVGRVGTGWNAVDDQIARTMSAYWVQFARSGDPNAAALPAWPRFRKDDEQVLEIADRIAAGPHPRRVRLDVLEAATRE